MLLSRIRGAPTLSGSHPSDCLSDIVAYWAPDDDPSFSGAEVRGPFWLTNTLDALPETGLGGALEGYRFWMSVPSAAVAENAGTEYLYVYFMVERDYYNVTSGLDVYDAETYAAGFKRGVHVRRIPLNWLLAWLPVEVRLRVEAKGLDTALRAYPLEDEKLTVSTDTGDITSDPTDESAWDELAAAGYLASGENLGRVRFFDVDDGSELFTTADPQIKTADPAVTTCNGELMLYVAATGDRTDALGLSRSLPYGVWRGSPSERYAAVYGVWFDISTSATSNVHQVAPGLASSDFEIYYDPDPVRLPDGTWLVFASISTGSLGPRATDESFPAVVQITGVEEDGCGSVSDGVASSADEGDEG